MASYIFVAAAVNSVVSMALIALHVFEVPLHLMALTAATAPLCAGLAWAIHVRPGYVPLAVWSFVWLHVAIMLSIDCTPASEQLGYTWHFAVNAAVIGIGGMAMSLLMLTVSVLSITVSGLAVNDTPVEEVATLALALIVTSIAIGFIKLEFVRALDQLQRSRDEMSRIADTDPLTGLANRLALDRHMARLVEGDDPFYLILLDIDHFKSVNDTFGHGVGDMVLKETARALARGAGEGTMVARIGGEEFCVVVPDRGDGENMERAEALRRCLADLTVRAEGRLVRFTASFGIARSAAPHRPASALLNLADSALYQAKDAGRNCCRIAAA